jgi:hypothetical protein
VTKGDGSGNSLYDPRTTGEMYPVYGDRWKDNELVPIPLQAINIQSYAKAPYSEYLTRDVPDLGTIVTMAHLNVTVRVWWETVLVNTTFYVGADLKDPGPDFVYTGGDTGYPGASFISEETGNGVTMQPLSVYYDWEYNLGEEFRLYDYLNASVFYFRCGARDDDLSVNGFDFGIYSAVGSALFDAQCLVNLRDKNANPYYLTHQRATTGEVEGFYAHEGPDGEYYGLSNSPHDWKGYLPGFRGYMRVPNATMWTGLIDKFGGVWIDGKEAWKLVYVSKYYTDTDDLKKNDPSLVAINTYLKTRTPDDDPGPYKGIRLEVLYAGGYKNLYGGLKQTVGVYTLQNPYLIALKSGDWVDPFDSAIRQLSRDN